MTERRVQPPVTIGLAGPDDAPTIVALIRELAAYEDLSEHVRITEPDVRRDGFGPSRRFECLIARQGGEPVGFALFYDDYSTFEGRPGLYLEDLYVRETERRRGTGRLLLRRLAAIARERGCVQIHLSVLDWNPARTFYESLGFRHQAAWLPYRVHGPALDRLAADGEETG